MIIQCTQCQTKYRLDESKFAGRPTKKIKCPKCAHIFEVRNPEVESEAASKPSEKSFAEAPKDIFPHAEETTDMKEGRENIFSQMNEGILELPHDKKLSLAIIQGNSQGKIYQIDKPRMVLGRANTDIVVNDMEVSRQHAALEVFSDRCIIRDLNSTNGTYVDGVKIKLHPLENHSEFRVGNTTMMLIITGITDEDML